MAFEEATTQDSYAGFSSVVTIDRPPSLAVGDLMVAFICNVETADDIDTGPSGWTNEGEFVISAAPGEYVTGWSRVAEAADVAAANFTWTWLANQVRPMGAILQYHNDIAPVTHMDTDNAEAGNKAVPASYVVSAESGGGPPNHDVGGIQLYCYAEKRTSGGSPTGYTGPAGLTLRAECDNANTTFFTHMVVYEATSATEDETEIIWTGGTGACLVGGGRFNIVGGELAGTPLLESAPKKKLHMKVTHLPYDVTRTMTRG